MEFTVATLARELPHLVHSSLPTLLLPRGICFYAVDAARFTLAYSVKMLVHQIRKSPFASVCDQREK